MMRRTPMNRGTKGLARTGFRFKPAGAGEVIDVEIKREQRLQERAARTVAHVRPRPGVTMASCSLAPAEPIEKDNPLRSLAYRKLVAAMPCAHCGVIGYSQHAHENGADKGKGLKTDDRRGFPLCCTRPGEEGCHVAFDNYRLLPGGREAHRAYGAQKAAETRALVMKSGRWPKRLPLWKETTDEVQA